MTASLIETFCILYRKNRVVLADVYESSLPHVRIHYGNAKCRSDMKKKEIYHGIDLVAVPTITVTPIAITSQPLLMISVIALGYIENLPTVVKKRVSNLTTSRLYTKVAKVEPTVDKK